MGSLVRGIDGSVLCPGADSVGVDLVGVDLVGVDPVGVDSVDGVAVDGVAVGGDVVGGVPRGVVGSGGRCCVVLVGAPGGEEEAGPSIVDDGVVGRRLPEPGVGNSGVGCSPVGSAGDVPAGGLVGGVAVGAGAGAAGVVEGDLVGTSSEAGGLDVAGDVMGRAVPVRPGRDDRGPREGEAVCDPDGAADGGAEGRSLDGVTGGAGRSAGTGSAGTGSAGTGSIEGDADGAESAVLVADGRCRGGGPGRPRPRLALAGGESGTAVASGPGAGAVPVGAPAGDPVGAPAGDPVGDPLDDPVGTGADVGAGGDVAACGSTVTVTLVRGTGRSATSSLAGVGR